MEKKLEVKDLKISFRTSAGKVQAVRDISFDLYKGETLAIVGESGSGKSVTNKAIIGISANNAIVESGEIIYDGMDLLKIDEEHLSCRNWQNELFHSLVRRENGLILFSGKTGSGKTTTLYNLLKQVSYKKIYTIEDPIEVYDENFVQLQVNRTAGLNYEHYVQQVLRHDPDIIMIGEIRDEKAARIAVVAANTGHLVLSTIHASSASSIISRMSELGVREDHLYEVLLCLSNQKMVNNTDGGKTVIYELMDEEEIEYFRKNGRNSEDFESVEKQYRQGVKENRFKVDS